MTKPAEIKANPSANQSGRLSGKNALTRKESAASTKKKSWGVIDSMSKVYNRKELLSAICIFFISFAVYLNVRELGDFPIFHQAASLVDPYQVIGFLNPAWTHAVIYPLRFFPQQVAYAVWMGFSMALVVLSVSRLGGDRLAYVLVFANPFSLTFATKGNIEVLALLGFVIQERPFDVLLLMVKPQMGITAALYRLWDYGLRDWLWLIAVALLSLVIWGNWPMAMAHNWLTGLYSPASVDVYPYGVLAGILILFLAITEKSEVGVFVAGYLLAPYMSHNSLYIYTVVIFSTFGTRGRLVLFAAVWAFFIVGFLVA